MNKWIQPYVDKVQAWNRNRIYKAHEYFTFEPTADNKGTQIRLLKGNYKGAAFTFAFLEFKEDLGYRGAQATFDITVTDHVADIKEGLPFPEEFIKIVGQIILVVLEYAIKNDIAIPEKVGFTNEEDREDYFEESVPERTVRSKDPAVSEDGVPSGKKRKNRVRGSSKVRSKVQPTSDE